MENSLILPSKRAITALITVFLIASMTAQAQLIKPKTVSVNIGGRVLAADATSSGIPFDEKFMLSGSSTGIEKIELTYRIDPHEANYTRYYGIALKKDKKLYSLTSKKVKGIDFKTKGDSLYVVVDEGDFGYIGNGGVTFTVKNSANTTLDVTYTYKDFKLTTSGNTLKSCSFIESPHYYPNLNAIGADGFTRDPEIWNADGTATFGLNAGPLHDNLGYNFRFKVFLKSNIGDKQDELATKIVTLLQTQLKFNNINKLQHSDYVSLGNEAAAVIRTYTDKRGQLVNEDQQPLLIDLSQSPFSELGKRLAISSQHVDKLQDAAKEVTARLLTKVDAFLPGTTLSAYGELAEDINDIKSGAAVLEVDAKKIWDAPVQGQTYPLSAVAAVVANGPDLLEVIKGTKKFKADGTLEAVNPAAVDPVSIAALWYFCQKINGNQMLATSNNKISPLFLTTGFHRFKSYMELLSAAVSAGDGPSITLITKEMETPTPGLLNDPASPIKTKLDLVTSGQHLSAETKKFLDQPLNATIADYKAMKISDALILLDNAFANPTIFTALINGSGKISGTYQSIEPTADGQVSQPSLQILINIFNLMDSPAFLDDADPHVRIFPANIHAGLIAHRLSNYLAKLYAIGPEVKDYSAFKDQFARLMADTYIKKTYILSGASVIDQNVDANKNPYVGLDIGMGYAFGINTVFLHEGLNIYLSPVNRDAAISSLHGWDRVRKTVSLFVGLTQSVSSSDVNDKYSNLFNDSSFKASALFGIGWRFSTLARLNVAGLVYREKSLNPLVTSTQVKVAPSATLSIDLSIGKLFKSISGLF